MHWSGDNSSSFHDLACSLRGRLSLGLCGFTFWAHDCGGFTGTPTDKLYIRATQLSILNSHIRYHGGGPRYREPWNYQPDTQRIVRSLLELRYRLIPYLYSESRHAAAHGWPLMSALVLGYPDDPTVRHIDDEYLLGRTLLCAPILTEDDTRQVYLPAGNWYDAWTGQHYQGPTWTTYHCPLERMPLFARAGTILPLGPVMQHLGERHPLHDLTLVIFPDTDGRAGYTLTDETGSWTFAAQDDQITRSDGIDVTDVRVGNLPPP